MSAGYKQFIEKSTSKIALSVLHAAERLLRKDSLNLTGQTPHEVIEQDGLMSVRHYFPLESDEITIVDSKVPVRRDRFSIPLVYIPPLLAPGFAFDLYPERSLARYFLARGFDVYLVDFGSPNKSHAHLSFEHYVLEWIPKALNAIRKDALQEQLSLLGYCMGGLFTLLYTAIHEDQQIKNIITIASPIDLHQMGAAGKLFSVMAIPAHKLASRLHISIRDVNPRFFHIPGMLGTIGFHLTNPFGLLKNQLDLLLHLWDRDYVIAQESLGHWINNLLDYPGATIQELIVQMGLANSLARKGTMTIGLKEAYLKNVNCSLLSFAGEDDKIVRVDSAHKIMDVVSSNDKSFATAPGGHVGVIIGREAPKRLWSVAADWLSERSGPVLPETEKNKISTSVVPDL